MRVLAATVGTASLAGVAPAQNAKDIVGTMVRNEREAALHKDRFAFLSNERSERTGGKLWTERVVETPVGRVRFLIQEDGKPLSPERTEAERARLADDVAHPDTFEKREAAQKDDEAHARAMLEVLTKGFILENMVQQNGDWRIDFRPDPAYSPQTMEEKVLHGMSGWMLVDVTHLRLHHIEARAPEDISLAMGLAKVHAGSNFQSTKALYQGQWRTVRVVSDIRGKAMLFKTLSRNQDVARTEFVRVDNNLSLAQAVALAEK